MIIFGAQTEILRGPGHLLSACAVWEAKSSNILGSSHPFGTSFWLLWVCFFPETFFIRLARRAFGRLLGPKWAGHAFGPCLAVFGEGRPFSPKVASETPPGWHFDDLGAILPSIWPPFALHFALQFCVHFFDAISEHFLQGSAAWVGALGAYAQLLQELGL